MHNEAHDVARRMVQEFFLLIQTFKAHGADHPMSQGNLERLHKLMGSKTPLNLQFVAGALFSEQHLVSVSREEHERFQLVARSWDALQAQELTIQSLPSVETLRELGKWLVRGALGTQLDITEARLPGLVFREITATTWGEETEEIDQGLYALSQMALAIQDASQLTTQGPWDWSRGFSVVRRLERAIESRFDNALRALEMEDGAWTPSRRALSAAFDTMAALRHVGVHASIVRACAHAALGLGVYGYQEHEGEELGDAARALFQGLVASRVRSQTGIPPHRLRTTTIVDGLARQPSSQWMRSLFLLQLCYDMEWERCPPGVEFTLTRADLLAMAAQEMGARFPPSWVRVLVSIHGDAPVGAYVRLPDQSLGVILGPVEGSSEVQVLVGADILSVTPPLQLISAAQAHGLW